MKETKELLKSLEDYDFMVEKSSLLRIMENLNISKNKHSVSLNDMKNNINIIKKKNSNIENEIEKLKFIQNKKNEMYQKVNNERLKLAKMYVEIENNITNLKNEVDKIEVEISKNNEVLKEINKPSFNLLYLELIKGFGVDFHKGTKYICRVRNKTKKDVNDIEIKKDLPLYKICNSIWNVM